MPLSKQNKTNDGPLSGILVIDASQGIAGPHCGATLASYGARVIKIEPPQGDWCRAIGKSYGTLTPYSIVYNRGKESLVLDLKEPKDLDILYQLVSQADIFMESSRPGIAKKIGIDFETMKTKNASLIYLSISGFGQKGPNATRPCTDGAAQAYSGFANANVGADGQSHKVDLPIIDITTGLYGFQSVSMALLQRMKTGEAQYLDINLVTSALELQKGRLLEQHVEGGSDIKLNVPSGVYDCADAKIVMALATEAHYQKMLTTLGLEDLKGDPRYTSFEVRAQNADSIRQRMETLFASEPASHWEKILGGAGIIVNKLNTLDDVLNDPDAHEGGMLKKVQEEAVGEIYLPVLLLMEGKETPAPQKGQDGEAILKEMSS